MTLIALQLLWTTACISLEKPGKTNRFEIDIQKQGGKKMQRKVNNVFVLDKTWWSLIFRSESRRNKSVVFWGFFPSHRGNSGVDV